MRLSNWAIALGLICSTQMAQADWSNSCCPSPCCDPCDFNFCDLNYSFYADFLYWKVSRTELYDDNSDVEFLNPDYEPGFRVGGNIMFSGCWDTGIRYTYYYNKKSKDLGDSTKSKYKLLYNDVDVELGYTFALDCVCATFRPFVGAKFAWIDEHFDDLGNENDGKTDYRGYGIFLGADANFNICGNFSFVARGSYGILGSRFRVSDSLYREREHVFVPWFSGFVGLDYELCDLCGLNSSILIGYEVEQWAWREFASNDDIAHLGLGGLTVRANVSF